MLKKDSIKPETFFIEDEDANLSRILITNDWMGDIDEAKIVLNQICDRWGKGRKVDFLITCGGFLTFNWPDDFYVEDNKYPRKDVIEKLIEEAGKQCENLLNDRLRSRLLRFTDYFTIGIDSYKKKISLSNVSIREPHVEIIALVDLHNNKYFWTGKSYPSSSQEDKLLRFQDLKTHFVDLPIGRIMILGGHDLFIFSPGGAVTTKKEWRRKTREEFYLIAKNMKPEIVLHHPHTTDSTRIWSASWNELLISVPTVKRYIGAGRYYRPEGERSDMKDVLDKNKLGNCIDCIVNLDDLNDL